MATEMVVGAISLLSALIVLCVGLPTIWWRPRCPVSPVPDARGEGGEAHGASSLSVDLLTDANRKEIVACLFQQWLEGFRSSKTPGRERLEQYRIHHVEIREDVQHLTGEPGADYVAVMTFSVKPVEMSGSDWIAGNGSIGQNWVRNKLLIVRVTKEARLYKLEVLGTGG